MFLKRLELIGFKSFAQKSVLDFPGGIVAVVGPNGSGKSNIIDAVRWILGEREAKNLRGGKSEDLIFAGTPEKPRLGIAEVRLSFENSSGFFPIDAKEITVTRQVTRDGISRYFLNKSEIRLKDVIDFFAKSRLGVKGLSIINQGESDIFVRSTPLERRAMIEEILGLREYQLKKMDAERKLKNTAININQAQTTMEELKPHLRMLKRQTSKWERRSEIAENLKAMENQLFSFKLSGIKMGLSSIRPAFSELEEKIKTAEKKLAERENVLKKIEIGQPEQLQELKTIRASHNSLFEKRSQIERELSRLEAKIELMPNEGQKTEAPIALLREIRETLSRNYEQTDWDSVKKLFQGLVAKIDRILNSSLPTIGKESLYTKTKLTKELENIESGLKQIAEQESQISTALEKFNSVFKAAFQELEAARVELSKYESEKNKFLFDRERLNMKLGDLEMQINQAGRKLNEFTVMPAIIIENPLGVEKEIFKLRGELAAIGEIDEMLLKEARETESRHDFLSGQLADLEKSSRDLQILIGDLENKIHGNFKIALVKINDEFNKYCRLMFGGGKAKLILEKPTLAKAEDLSSEASAKEGELGINVEVSIPDKKIKGLDMLSGGERSLVSIAALFALVSVSPPPFLILDEIDAALDERNSKKFSQALKEFSKHTQFILVTHNRSTMEAANVLYGVTMQSDGTSKLLSVKLKEV
ncbi:MAG: Chromosome partition protein Smc [Parcubacteria group bacterium GW2011_GWB1_45_9]|nr:MAG: Chromosome partition protein Smc [Parcubacteria group bacterium GW2011_GWB1_45_9]